MNRGTRRTLIVLFGATAVASLASLIVLRGGRPLYYTDGDRSASAFRLRDQPMLVWDRPVPDVELKGPVLGRVQALRDGRLCYGLVGEGGTTDLVTFDPRRPELAPVPLRVLNSKAHDLAPALDADGALYFASDRRGGQGGFDLYRAPWLGERFGAPAPLPPTINTAADEVDPAPQPGSAALVFVRRHQSIDEGKNGQLTIALTNSDRPAEPLFPAEPEQDRRAWSPGGAVIDREPAFAPDGVCLWFVRQEQGRPPVVHCTWRHQDRFLPPVPQPELSGDGAFRAPLPGGDGFAVRLLKLGAQAILYRAGARQVYPWWAGQYPLELILLIALLVSMLLLILLLLGARWRQLDIITWCVLLSLLIHILVLLWLAGVEIMKQMAPAPATEDRLAVRLLAARHGGGAAQGALAQEHDDLAQRMSFLGREDPVEVARPESGVAAQKAQRAARSGARAPEPVAPEQRAQAAALADALAPVPTRAGTDRLGAAQAAAPEAVARAAAEPDDRRAAVAAGAIEVRVPSSRTLPAVGAPSARVAARGERAPGEVDARDAAVAAAVHDAPAAPALRSAPAGEALSGAPTAALAPASAAAAESLPAARPAPAAPTTTDERASRPAPELAAAAAAAARRGPAGEHQGAAEPKGAEPQAALRDAPAARPAGVAATAESLPAAGPSGAGLDGVEVATPAVLAARAGPSPVASEDPAVAVPHDGLPDAARRARADGERVAQELRERTGSPQVALHDGPERAAPGAAAVAAEVLPAVGSAGLPTDKIAAAPAELPAARSVATDRDGVAATVALPENGLLAAAPRPPAAPERRSEQLAARAGAPPVVLRDAPERPSQPEPRVAAAESLPVAGSADAPTAGMAEATFELPAERSRSADDGEVEAAVAIPADGLPSALPRAASVPERRPDEVAARAGAPAVALRDDAGPPGAPVGLGRRAVEDSLAGPIGTPVALLAGPSTTPAPTPRRGDRTTGGLDPVSSGIRLPPSDLGPAPRLAAPRAEVVAIVASMYSNRFGPQKAEALERFGGTAETEHAVAQGLRYLASIQHRQGHWGDARRGHDKYGEVYVGKTALCLLAFLGAGHTHRSDTEYSNNVRRAIDALLEAQDGDTGHFGATSSYSHGISTYALAECYAITSDERLRAPIERAVRWILSQQSSSRDRRNRGGWGYFSPTLRPEDGFSRTSVSSWMIMALESAKISGIEVPGGALERAEDFLVRMFDEDYGYFLYNKEPGRLDTSWRTLPASTPAAVFCLLLLDHDPGDYRVRVGLEYTVERRPRRYRKVSEDAFVRRADGNVYFWYYGTLACFLAGGEVWDDWNRELRTVLPEAQNADGSFTPIGAYAGYANDRRGDYSYTTAMVVLSLEVYYRYFTPLLEKR